MYSTTCHAAEQQHVLHSLAEHLAHLTDHRHKRGVRYPLAPLLVMLVSR